MLREPWIRSARHSREFAEAKRIRGHSRSFAVIRGHSRSFAVIRVENDPHEALDDAVATWTSPLPSENTAHSDRGGVGRNCIPPVGQWRRGRHHYQPETPRTLVVVVSRPPPPEATVSPSPFSTVPPLSSRQRPGSAGIPAGLVSPGEASCAASAAYQAGTQPDPRQQWIDFRGSIPYSATVAAPPGIGRAASTIGSRKMRTLLQILSAISFAISGFFALKLLVLFAPDRYDEFTGLVAIIPAAGCIVSALAAILLLTISFFIRTRTAHSADPRIPNAEHDVGLKGLQP